MKTIIMCCILAGCFVMGAASHDRFNGPHQNLKTYMVSFLGMLLSLLIALGAFVVYCFVP